MGEDEMRSVLKQACEAEGNQSLWANKHDIKPGYVSEVLRGRRSPIDVSDSARRMLEALGLEITLRRRTRP